MSKTPLVAQEIRPANPRLWAIKAYLDLISRDDPLVYGSGLKRLYTMVSGLPTFNEVDIISVTKKSEKMGLLPASLHGFMMRSILKNCHLYGITLCEMINSRIVSIANGDIVNPDPQLKYNPIESRRYYYLPDFNFVKRVQKALLDDINGDFGFGNKPVVTSIQDVANEADFILTQMQGNEGRIYPNQSSFGALSSVVDRLRAELELEANCPVENRDYRRKARGALKILWFIAKLLYGDLTVRPERKDLSVIDLDSNITMSDGTLAAIPFPIRQSLGLFIDDEGHGLTMKGRTYLSAVAAAAFDHRYQDNER